MQTEAQMILEPSEGAPPAHPPMHVLSAARPSRELIGRLAKDADVLRAAGNLEDAVFLLDVALAARLAERAR